MRPIQSRIRVLLLKGTRTYHPKVSSVCRELLKVEECLWTFIRVAGVEPTNNKAERAIRKGVIWRKMCFGTHSPQGSRFVERILTVSESLRQQNRNVLQFVYAAQQARLYGTNRPSLIPGSSTVNAAIAA